MAVTLTQLAAELRIGDGENAPAEPIAGILTRILSVATRLVQRYAPQAEEEVQDEAVILVAAHVYATDPAGTRRSYPNAMLQSGAAAVLDMYRGPQAHELRAQSSEANGGGESMGGGDGVDQVARDRASDALTRAIQAEGEAETALTTATQADAKATVARSTADDASTQAAAAQREAQAAKADADAASSTADENTQSIAAIGARLDTAEQGIGAASTAASAAETAADDAQADADANAEKIKNEQALLRALSGRVDEVNSRTPTADPAGNRVWRTNSAGQPSWRADNRSGVSIDSSYTRDWGDLPNAHGWGWEIARTPGTVYLYPLSRAGLRLTTGLRLLQQYHDLYFEDSKPLSFRRRGQSSTDDLTGADLVVSRGSDNAIYMRFDGSQEYTEGKASETEGLDIEWMASFTSDAEQVTEITFTGDRIDFKSGSATITPTTANEALMLADDARARADEAQDAADAAQSAADAARAIADRLAGLTDGAVGIAMRTPTADPPTDSSWSTDESGVPAWLPTPQRGIHVGERQLDGDTYNEWDSPGHRTSLGVLWRWEQRARAVGDNYEIALTPTLNGQHLSGDANRADLTRWTAEVFPSGRTQLLPVQAASVETATVEPFLVYDTDIRQIQSILVIILKISPTNPRNSWTAEADQGTTSTNLPMSVRRAGVDVDHAVTLLFDDFEIVEGTDEGVAHLKYEGTDIRQDLADETARAEAAEKVLTDDLAAEVTRAEAAEKVLTDNLASEVTRAEAAEKVLTDDLASEVTRAEAAEKVLTDDLAAEVTRATTKDAALDTKIDAETTARANAINAEQRARSGQINAANTNRRIGDEALSDRLDVIEANDPALDAGAKHVWGTVTSDANPPEPLWEPPTIMIRIVDGFETDWEDLPQFTYLYNGVRRGNGRWWLYTQDPAAVVELGPDLSTTDTLDNDRGRAMRAAWRDFLYDTFIDPTLPIVIRPRDDQTNRKVVYITSKPPGIDEFPFLRFSNPSGANTWTTNNGDQIGQIPADLDFQFRKAKLRDAKYPATLYLPFGAWSSPFGPDNGGSFYLPSNSSTQGYANALFPRDPS